MPKEKFPQGPNHPEAGGRPDRFGEKLVRSRVGRAALGLALVASGAVGIARTVGGSSESNRVTTERVEPEPLPPVTRESTPELDGTHEQIEATAIDLSDRIMDLYDVAPEDRRSIDTESMPGTAVITVSLDAAPTADGIHGNYAISTHIDLDEGGNPDPRLVGLVSISVYEITDELPINRYSFNLRKTESDWSLTEVTEPVDGQSTYRELTTAPVQATENLGVLTPESVVAASQEAARSLDMAEQRAPIN